MLPRFLLGCALPVFLLSCGTRTAQGFEVARLRPSEPAQDGGAALSFDLGKSRTPWTNARWAVARFEQPVDWSHAGGLRIRVRTQLPRCDAGVSLAVLESDGSWHVHPWAVELTAPAREGLARWADFTPADFIAPPKPDPASKEGGFDENGRLDLDSLAGVAVGVVNPFGIGRVEFVVESIEPAPAGTPRPPTPAGVRMTGRWLDVNGTTILPAGLFGAFNLPKGHTDRYHLAQDRRNHHDGLTGGPDYGNETTPRMINTVGDRVRPSPRLTTPDWESRCRAYGERFGVAARGKTTYVEYWNEPNLNWANRNRANFNPAFYDETRAAEGGRSPHPARRRGRTPSALDPQLRRAPVELVQPAGMASRTGCVGPASLDLRPALQRYGRNLRRRLAAGNFPARRRGRRRDLPSRRSQRG